MDGLSAIFLDDFEFKIEAGVKKAIYLKKALVDSTSKLDRHQAWRRIVDMQQNVERQGGDFNAALLEHNIDINSIRLAYIKPDDLGEVQLKHFKKVGKTFVDANLDKNLINKMNVIHDYIEDILMQVSFVKPQIDEIEDTLIEPLMSEARGMMGRLSADHTLNSKIDDIQVQIENIYKDKIDPIINNAATSAELSSNQKKILFNLKTERKSVGVNLMSKFYDSVMSESSISDTDAELWSSAQEISNSAVARIRRGGYPLSAVRRDLASYYKMVNGRIDNVRIITTGSKRSSAIVNSATIDIDDSFSRRTMYHELSHILEVDDALREANQAFIKSRATGAPEMLSKLTGNSAYSKNEIALPDHFFSPYVGKVYQSGATEVSAMGMQQFSSMTNMYRLYDRDPEMFSIMVGTMFGMSDAQKLRQKDKLGDKLLADGFYKLMKSQVKKLSWLSGHRYESDEDWENVLNGRRGAYNKRWYWKRSIGECSLMPAKASKERKQFYVVELNDGKRHFFTEMLLAETFCYLYELHRLDIRVCSGDIFKTVSQRLPPSWYQYGGNLPSI